ncbi:hypothetical protein AAHA92_26285 [Salvia divinorum]|uniref:Uncharacterized protein n=1 Tax=Salvia divinorum TaxID=28513 RepID=A0ABD1GDG4_SALDI
MAPTNYYNGYIHIDSKRKSFAVRSTSSIHTDKPTTLHLNSTINASVVVVFLLQHHSRGKFLHRFFPIASSRIFRTS